MYEDVLMPANLNRPHLWKKDIADSIDCYNSWFVQFAPQAYRDKRLETAKTVEQAFIRTSSLRAITSQILREHPSLLSVLRMSTAPPVARDRLIGLAGVKPSLIKKMETEHCLPSRMKGDEIGHQLESVVKVLRDLLDIDLFPWLGEDVAPSQSELLRSIAVVSDRLCGAMVNPIIEMLRNKGKLPQFVTGYSFEDTLRSKTAFGLTS
jgi:hypothetical protein